MAEEISRFEDLWGGCVTGDTEDGRGIVSGVNEKIPPPNHKDTHTHTHTSPQSPGGDVRNGIYNRHAAKKHSQPLLCQKNIGWVNY